MFWTRMYLALLISAMMAIPASAQSGLHRGWAEKMARKGHASSAANANTANHSSEADDDDRVRLEGTWRASGKFSGGTDEILYTFGAGKDPSKGVVVHSDNLFLVAVPSCLSAQGVWKRTGPKSFIATDEGFCFDSTQDFAPAGKIKFEIAIRLNRPGTEFDGTIHIDGFDPDGNLVFSDDGELHGTRMQAEAPPPA